MSNGVNIIAGNNGATVSIFGLGGTGSNITSGILYPDIIDIPATILTPIDGGNKLVFNYSNISGNYTPQGNAFKYKIYPYQTIGTGRLYAQTPLTYTGIDNNDNVNFANYWITANWKSVTNASGYRVVVIEDDEYLGNGGGGNHFDTANTGFIIGLFDIGYDSLSLQYYQVGTAIITPSNFPYIGFNNNNPQFVLDVSGVINTSTGINFLGTASLITNSYTGLNFVVGANSTYSIGGQQPNVIFYDLGTNLPIVAIGSDYTNAGGFPNNGGEITIIGKSDRTKTPSGHLSLVGGLQFADLNFGGGADNRSFVIRSKTPSLSNSLDSGYYVLFENKYNPTAPDADTAYANFLACDTLGNVQIGDLGQIADITPLSPNSKVTIYGSVSNSYSAFEVITQGWSSTGIDFIINHSGLVGIKQSNPQYQLDVNGSGHFTSGIIASGIADSIITTTGTVQFNMGINYGTVLISGQKTVVLPSGQTPGFTYTIKQIALASTGTISGLNNFLIDGSGTYLLTGRYNAVTVQSDGTNWWIINKI